MSSGIVLPRGLLIYGLSLPFAILLGYMLSSPESFRSILAIAMVLLLLGTPILLRWHHPLLVFCWNAVLSLQFLPGQLSFGIILAGIGFCIILVSRALNKQMRFISAPEVTKPLLFLLVLVFVNAKINGIGIQTFGSGAFGGKNYFLIVLAIFGYFVLTAYRIPRHLAQRYSSMFFISAVTAAIGSMVYLAGPKFIYLNLLFPISAGYLGEYEVRLGGIGVAAMAVYSYLLQKHGLRGLMDPSRPWRWLLLLGVIAGCLMGSFRSHLILLIMYTVVQFFLEGLHKTRLLAVGVLSVMLGLTVLFAVSPFLPLAAQRTLSFLPFRIDPLAKRDAEASTQWRLEMWKSVLPDAQRYWLKGKGYGINPTELYLAQESMARGFARNYEETIIVGDFHNGLLSLIIPFGIFGVLGFFWFLRGSWKVLYHNYRYGDPALQRINTFFLTVFVTRTLFYLVFFGSFYSDLWFFTGLVGMSLALNHGKARPAMAPAPQPVMMRSPILRPQSA